MELCSTLCRSIVPETAVVRGQGALHWSSEKVLVKRIDRGWMPCRNRHER